jgi:hypothetical protein
MKQAKEFQIGDKIFTVVPYVTSEGVKLLTEIASLLGPGIVKIGVEFKGLQGKTESSGGGLAALLEADIDSDVIASALNDLFAKLTPEKMVALQRRILRETFCASAGSHTLGEDAVFDDFFRGEYSLLFKVVTKTLEAQYGDFFGALGVVAKANETRQKVAAMAAMAPKTQAK